MIVGCRWVCNVKYKSDATLDRYKARRRGARGDTISDILRKEKNELLQIGREKGFSRRIFER